MILTDLLPPGLLPLRNAPDLVAGVLREAISSGRLLAGQPLRQVQLAAELGVSRIPLREALRQLEAEGLVRHKANRGVAVAALSWREVEEIGEMRVALETRAIQHAARGADAAVIAEAADCLHEADGCDDPGRLSELNHRFHAILYRAAGRPLLLDAIERLHANVNRYMRLVLGDLGHQRTSQREHRELLDAVRDGDGDRGAATLERHITAATGLLVRHLKNAERRDIP